MVICLEQGADLHMAQLMPLPLIVSCYSKIQIGFTFLVPAHPVSPGKRDVKWVCVWVSHYRKSILRQTSDNLITNRKIFCKSGPRSFIVGRDRTAQLLYKTLTAGGSVGGTACRHRAADAPPQRCSCWRGFRGNAKCIQRAARLTSHAIVVRRSQQPLQLCTS